MLTFLASDSEEVEEESLGRQQQLQHFAARGQPRKGEAAAAADSSSQAQQQHPIKALVWGLNDKDQLGGLKGSKIKLPVYSQVRVRCCWG